MKMFLELNDNVRELKDSIGTAVIIAPEMCRPAMLNMRYRLQLYVQSGGQHFEHLCGVVDLHFRQRGTPTSFYWAVSSMNVG